MPENTYPTCDGCGEQHPPITLDDVVSAYQSSVAVILQEAAQIAEEHGEHFTRLREAVNVAEEAAGIMLRARLAEAFGQAPAQAPTTPEREDFRPGMYL